MSLTFIGVRRDLRNARLCSRYKPLGEILFYKSASISIPSKQFSIRYFQADSISGSLGMLKHWKFLFSSKMEILKLFIIYISNNQVVMSFNFKFMNWFFCYSAFSPHFLHPNMSVVLTKT